MKGSQWVFLFFSCVQVLNTNLCCVWITENPLKNSKNVKCLHLQSRQLYKCAKCTQVIRWRLGGVQISSFIYPIVSEGISSNGFHRLRVWTGLASLQRSAASPDEFNTSQEVTRWSSRGEAIEGKAGWAKTSKTLQSHLKSNLWTFTSPPVRNLPLWESTCIGTSPLMLHDAVLWQNIMRHYRNMHRHTATAGSKRSSRLPINQN